MCHVSILLVESKIGLEIRLAPGKLDLSMPECRADMFMFAGLVPGVEAGSELDIRTRPVTASDMMTDIYLKIKEEVSIPRKSHTDVYYFLQKLQT